MGRKKSSTGFLINEEVLVYSSDEIDLSNVLTPRTNLRTLGLMFCTLIYLLIGAAVFEWLESENEIQQRVYLETREMKFLDLYNISEVDRERLRETLVQLVPYRAGSQWQFSGSLFFVITVITTIG